MTAIDSANVIGREAGFLHDIRAVAGRALRQIHASPHR